MTYFRDRKILKFMANNNIDSQRTPTPKKQ